MESSMSLSKVARITAALTVAALIQASCAFKEPVLSTPYSPRANPEAVFDPGSGSIPFPSNLLLDPATGRVALPTTGLSAQQQALVAQVNSLYGFSTLPTVTFEFSAAVDPATVTVDTVKVFKVTGSTLAPVYNYRVRMDSLSLQNLYVEFDTPLDEGATYLVVLTDGMYGDSGLPVRSGPIFNILKSDSKFAGMLIPLLLFCRGILLRVLAYAK